MIKSPLSLPLMCSLLLMFAPSFVYFVWPFKEQERKLETTTCIIQLVTKSNNGIWFQKSSSQTPQAI